MCKNRFIVLCAAVIALMITMLLSGCTAPVVAPKSTAEPTSEPEPTANPTPTPTPAPTEALSQREIDPDGKMVALTFDDGPHATVTRRIADCLEQYGGRGTFFVVGDRVSANSKTLSKVASAGHQIGSHTWNHKNLDSLSAEGVASQVHRTQDAIREVVGSAPRILRPPYGSANASSRAIIRDTADLAIVNWSVDSEDWKSRNADAVVREVMKNVKDGDIVLMHDLYTSTAEAVERIVPRLIDEGYQLVTVDELYRLRGDSLEGGSLHFKNPLSAR